jgi:hypothetical protein
MRLRYLYLPDYHALREVAVVFGQNTHMKRQGGINFVVGLNGTGKSSLLRAVYEVFRSLSAEELPKFPVTLAYDMRVDDGWDELDERWGKRSRDEIAELNKEQFYHRTVVFHRPRGAASECFLIPSADCLDFATAEEWQDYVENKLAPKGNADSLGTYVRGDQLIGNGTLRNWLPTRVLAYTSGDPALWDAMAYPHFPADELKDDPQDFSREAERPIGWTAHDEEADARTPKEGDPAFDRPLGGVGKDSKPMNERCILLRPEDVRLAAVSVGIWQAALELEDRQQEFEREAFRTQLLAQLDAKKAPTDIEPARRLLNELDWLWPTHAAFQFNSYGQHMAHPDAARCYWLHALASAVVQHPLGEWQTVVALGPCPPVDPHALVGELNLETSADLHLHGMSQSMKNAHCGAEALRSLFGGEQDSDETLWSIFSGLRSWRNFGLLKDVRLTVKRIRQTDGSDGKPDDRIHCYDQFSDGEQMLLGRMGLLLLLRQQPNSLLLLDEPETHFNDAWKRQIIDMVDDSILKNTSVHVLVATHTSLALTDVFSTEITRLVKEKGITTTSPVAHPTFGADPGRILLHVFGAPDVIGARAAEFLREKLDPAKWPPEDREKLRLLIDDIGSGWPRAKLLEILDELGPAPGDLPHAPFDS